MKIGYKTQSSDTCIEAELLQFQLWKNLTPQQRLNLVKKIYKKAHNFLIIGIKNYSNNCQESKLRKLYIQKKFINTDIELQKKLNYEGELMLEDPIWLAQKLGNIFEDLNIPYYVGGSVASSLQGEVRFTEDLDLIINLKINQVTKFINIIAQEFYLSEIAVEQALNNQTSSFNIIHLQTLEKADIFISREDNFSKSKMERRQLFYTDQNKVNKFYICSPEDTILQKILWFTMTKNESQKQWRDILGVLKLQGEKLDFDYLWYWASFLNISEIIDLAFQQAGL